MKHLYKTCLYLLALTVASCADNSPLGFTVEKPESIAAQEALNAYKSLKTYIDTVAYPTFKLGAGVSLADYTSKGVMYRLINNNFKEITPSTGMNHENIVQADGSFVFDNVNSLLSIANSAGTSVFGHSLVGNRNQNATYLGNLIAPLVVVPPTIANSLNLTGLKDASLSGWGTTNSGAGISVVSGAGLVNTLSAVKMISGASSSAAEQLQLITPDVPVVAGHTYEIIFYIKSDVPGEGRVAFEGLGNNTPSKDWMNTGKVTATFKTSISWQQVKIQVKDFTGSTFKVHLDLGYQPNVTYFVDVNNFSIYDTQGTPAIINLISNGTFEAGNTNGWGGWGNGSTMGVSTNGQGNPGYAMWKTNPSLVAYYVVQSAYGLPAALENGQKYTLSFDVKADNTGDIIPELQSPNYSSNGFGKVYLTTSWQHMELTVTTTAADRNKLVISYGEMKGTVYMDNIMLYKTSGASTTQLTVPKTDIAKQQIIGDAMSTWISGMVTNCKPTVKAWDVVNEPMDDANPANVKSGVGKTLAADEFYWQDYLGKDYAVQAFTLARQKGNTGDLFFINDNNLESNIDKCTGLIQYVSYIESKGAKVDGIGTKMHISVSSDKDKIATMFQLLAASGKLIRISELDVDVNTATPSSDLLQQQAAMYKYVVQMYYKYVPAAQRYGITVWSPVDNKGLWNYDSGNYTRKPAYTGFADGLSGATN